MSFCNSKAGEKLISGIKLKHNARKNVGVFLDDNWPCWQYLFAYLLIYLFTYLFIPHPSGPGTTLGGFQILK